MEVFSSSCRRFTTSAPSTVPSPACTCICVCVWAWVCVCAVNNNPALCDTPCLQHQDVVLSVLAQASCESSVRRMKAGGAVPRVLTELLESEFPALIISRNEDQTSLRGGDGRRAHSSVSVRTSCCHSNGRETHTSAVQMILQKQNRHDWRSTGSGPHGSRL